LSIELNRQAGVTTTRLPAARPTATMLVVSAAAFLASLDLFIVNIAFPDIRECADGGNHADAYLPAQLFTGMGVGLVMPSLSAVTGVTLPAHRWGAGSAVTNTARQMGMVLGTTALTMIYQPGVDLAAVRRGWVFVASAPGASALIAAGLAIYWKPAAEGRLNPPWPQGPRSAARRRRPGPR
jgi:hypothetical protein